MVHTWVWSPVFRSIDGVYGSETLMGRSGLLAAGMLVVMGMATAQPLDLSINLSTIDAGVGFGFVINGEMMDDGAGIRVSAAGDVNGDGLGDVVVGASAADPGGLNSAGRCYVVFGKNDSVAVDLSQVASGTSLLGFVINPQEANDRLSFGASSAGDVNGDGLADLIVGAPSTYPNSLSNPGRSYVVFGKSSAAAVELSAVASGASTLGFLINGQAAQDYAGINVSAAGDVNGDGLADVLVGAFFSDPPAGANAGRAYVVFGKTNSTIVNLSTVANGSSGLGFVMNGQAANDALGAGVSSAGDVNGDGLADLIVGATFSSPPAGLNAGRSYVVFGKPDSAAVNMLAVASGTSPLGFVINGQAAGDTSGRRVSSAGDVNGDGLADLIIGAYLGDPPAGSNAGRSYVIFGKTIMASVNLSAVATGSSALGFTINGQAAGDRSGFSVSSAGDVDGDGLADIIIGAADSDPAGGAEAGRCYVVRGKTGPQTVELSDVAAGDSFLGFVINGQAAQDSTGQSVSGAGDVNGDGLADLIVGANGGDPAAVSNAGRSYVLFSPYAPVASGTYIAQTASGDPDRQGIGTNRLGDDRTVFPDSRLWIDFDGGSGPGLAGSSSVTATLTRSDPAVVELPAFLTADVSWEISTDRAAWTNAAVTVRYTDSEIAGLDEGSLVLRSAPTLAGPFTPVAGYGIDSARNEASGTVDSLPRVFALTADDITPPTANIVRLNQNPNSSDVADFLVLFSEPVASTFTTADITLDGTLAPSSFVFEIIDTDPIYVVRVIAQPLNQDGTLGITIGTDVSDALGNPLLQTASPLYQFYRPGLILGDVNLSRTVNVADVTALADHIVNGTPLP